MTRLQRTLMVLIGLLTLAGVAVVDGRVSHADRILICETTCGDYRCQTTITTCR